jgi:hypothetical protein
LHSYGDRLVVGFIAQATDTRHRDMAPGRAGGRVAWMGDRPVRCVSYALVTVVVEGRDGAVSARKVVMALAKAVATCC